jgi:hypothetical protein
MEAVGTYQPGVRRTVESMVGDELIKPAAERDITVKKGVIKVEESQPLHPGHCYLGAVDIATVVNVHLSWLQSELHPAPPSLYVHSD